MGDYSERKIVAMLILVTMICLISLILFIMNQYGVWEAAKSSQICEANMTERPSIEGVYFSEGYYCVWVAGRNLKDINDTDTHERCHALVDDDKRHFCGDWVG